jgi:hypothetical protein
VKGLLRIDDPAKIKELREVLDDLHYDTVLRGLRGKEYFVQPWPDFHEMEMKIERLESPLKACLNLFLLGKTLQLKEVGWLEVDDLVEIGLLRMEKGEVRTAGYSIIPYLGMYFVLHPPAHYPTSMGRVPVVYMGRDSYRLGQNLFTEGGEVLDLCTGSGIIAILAASHGGRALGVEINQEAANVARFNTILNNLEDRVKILKGDLFEPIGTQRFDIIYANPPFVPVPPGLVYSLYGDGGVDGLKVIRRILEGLDHHLHLGGRFMMVGDAIGDGKAPFFVRILERLSHEKNWGTKVFLYGGEEDHLLLPIYFYKLANYSILPETMNLEGMISEWMRPYKEMGAEYVYSFTLTIKKQSSSGGVELIRMHTPWTKRSIPVLVDGVVVKPLAFMGGVYREEELLFSVKDETLDLLVRCNGALTVEEIVNEIFGKYSSRYRGVGVDGALASALQECERLERKGVLLRREER